MSEPDNDRMLMPSPAKWPPFSSVSHCCCSDCSLRWVGMATLLTLGDNKSCSNAVIAGAISSLFFLAVINTLHCLVNLRNRCRALPGNYPRFLTMKTQFQWIIWVSQKWLLCYLFSQRSEKHVGTNSVWQLIFAARSERLPLTSVLQLNSAVESAKCSGCKLNDEKPTIYRPCFRSAVLFQQWYKLWMEALRVDRRSVRASWWKHGTVNECDGDKTHLKDGQTSSSLSRLTRIIGWLPSKTRGGLMLLLLAVLLNVSFTVGNVYQRLKQPYSICSALYLN